MYHTIQSELAKLVDPEKAAFFPHFFKTHKGAYGEGDLFLGVSVPAQRNIAKKYFARCTLEDISILLESPLHEHRLTALLILVLQYKKASQETQRKLLYEFYLSHTHRVNNWDLVDSSAYHILGAHLLKNSSTPEQTPPVLQKLAGSKMLWERRIAIVSTFAFIRKGVLSPTYKIAEMLLKDKEDLMHKACGWMLREAGKIDSKRLLVFLEKEREAKLPRTLLRYAIEKYPPEIRAELLKKIR